MFYQNRVIQSRFIGSVAGLGFFLALVTSSVSVATQNSPHNRGAGMAAAEQESTSHFQKIEQPVGVKLAVVLLGMVLIGAELWWFMFSKTSKTKNLKRNRLNKQS